VVPIDQVGVCALVVGKETSEIAVEVTRIKAIIIAKVLFFNVCIFFLPIFAFKYILLSRSTTKKILLQNNIHYNTVISDLRTFWKLSPMNDKIFFTSKIHINFSINK
jgi:hypothetical protein